MALQTVYQQFLASPNPALLADDASLHYITTLVTLNGPSEIIKHLRAQSNELKKKEEKYLDAIEAPDALAVEVHTTVEFATGGGAYLPGLDDNFLADRTVTFPIIHIVAFDAHGKIQQIRQNWDQGSLLKLIDVIGKTGRNWPICDGKDQIKLISSSVKSSGKHTVDPEDSHARLNRSRDNSTNATRDPHASLSLFQPRQKNVQESLPAVVAPRSSAKPPPRDYHDLFVAQDKPPANNEEYESPPKGKAGAGKSYAPSRLFDNDGEEELSPERPEKKEASYKPNPARYQHFDLAEEQDQTYDSRGRPLKPVKSGKHGNQWTFDDFNTPQKVVPTKLLRTNDVRHWGNSDDEVLDSPIKQKRVDKPRKDAETHFAFEDDGTPEASRRIIATNRGPGQNGKTLYRNHLFTEDEDTREDYKPVLANTKDRRKDFDPHFEMTDSSPVTSQHSDHIPEARHKAVKMMNANWEATDHSPSQKENARGIQIAGDGMGGKKPLVESTNTSSNRNGPSKGIAIGGDGMGGKAGNGRQWGFGDESDGEEEGGRNVAGKYKTGKQGQAKGQATAGGDFWDF